MQQLTPEGQQTVANLAQRYGFSQDAVMSMLYSLVQGNGAMAQFNHPEFAGSGQWMQGGMTMVSDMFNNALKANIDGLCYELSNLLASQPFVRQPVAHYQGGQQQSQYGGSQQQQSGSGPGGQASLFISPMGGGSGHWWGDELGAPSSTGSQNNVRYAYFPGSRRLAIDVNGQVTVYDTLDHQIGGVSQQQSVGGSLTFTSQYGMVSVADLPVVSGNSSQQPSTSGYQQSPAPAPDYQQPPASGYQQSPAPAPGGGGAQENDIFAAIERLAGLKAKGILTEDEFSAKKAELLSRL